MDLGMIMTFVLAMLCVGGTSLILIVMGVIEMLRRQSGTARGDVDYNIVPSCFILDTFPQRALTKSFH